MRLRPGRADAWRLVAAPLVTSRLLWMLVVIAVVHHTMPTTPTLTAVGGSLRYWDARIYLDIAGSGYPPTRCSIVQCDYHDAFLPGLPLLISSATLVVRDPVLAGWLVSLLAEAVALWYIARLVAAERDRAAAQLSVWLVALAPTALFFTAIYTEAPFIAAVAASLYHARRGETQKAAIAGAIACCFRLTALALLPALALEHVVRKRWRRPSHLVLLAIIPVPLVAYCVYMQLHTGDAFAYLDAQRSPSFDHTLAYPWDGLQSSWNTMLSATSGETRSIFAREVAFGLLGLALCCAMWASRRIPASLSLYCTLAWLFASSLSFWRSEPRYDLALFPSVLLVADLTARVRTLRPALVAASGALMCAGVAIYSQGRWLG